jgi:hypothetical protein
MARSSGAKKRARNSIVLRFCAPQRRGPNQDMRSAPRCPNPVRFPTILARRARRSRSQPMSFRLGGAFGRWPSAPQWTSMATGLCFAHAAQVALDCLHGRGITLWVTRLYLGTYLSCLRRLIDTWQGLSATLPKNIVDQCRSGRPANVGLRRFIPSLSQSPDPPNELGLSSARQFCSARAISRNSTIS